MQAPGLYVENGASLEPFEITPEVEAKGVRLTSRGDLVVDFSKPGITEELRLSGGVLGARIYPAGSYSVQLNICWAFKLQYRLKDR